MCRDIPEEACREQPGNVIKHILSLAATKTGDGLADPKLVLSWLLNALGAPAFFVGLLVPIRESGALLPQQITSGANSKIPLKKFVWSFGSLLQGLAIAGIALTAFFAEGAIAGWLIVSLLAVFSVARSICSVSHKDVIGKTVAKSNRGTVVGTAVTISATIVLAFGFLLSFGLIPKDVVTVALVVLIAGGLWVVAAIIFSTIAEKADKSEPRKSLYMILEHLSVLQDSQLRIFILTRALLISTALTPPFLISLSGSGGRQFGQLGPFVIASGLAAIFSSYIWGRLSDRSSRSVLSYSGLIASFALCGVVALGIFKTEILSRPLVIPAFHFALMIAYQGVRIGRATHIVDMSSEGLRAAYTAISNTLIGLILIIGSLFGLIAQVAGINAVLAIFAIMAFTAFVSARFLDEVQQ